MLLTKEDALMLAQALDALGSYRSEEGCPNVNTMGLKEDEETLRENLHRYAESEDV